MMDRDLQGVLIAMGVGFVGIILAAIEKILYDSGTIIDEFITGSITIENLMAITIIMFLLIGVILATVRS